MRYRWMIAAAFASALPPLSAATLHRIHGCVLETRDQLKDRLVKVRYIDLGQVRDIQVFASGDKVLDNATLELNAIGTPLKPYRLDPGSYRTSEIVETYIRCRNPAGMPQ